MKDFFLRVGPVLGILAVAFLMFVWQRAYVAPNDAHNRQVRSCMSEQRNDGGPQEKFETYKVCHNQHIDQAGGLVATFHPAIPAEYKPSNL